MSAEEPNDETPATQVPDGEPTAAENGESTADPVEPTVETGGSEEGLESTSRWHIATILKWIGLGVAMILFVVAVMAVWPASSSGLGSDASPTTTYDQAIERYESLTNGEPGVIYEPCESQLLEHGERTEVVVVLFHGLTNCPQQFLEFGQELFEDGANVLILRAPHHGKSNSAGDGVGSVSNVESLTASELRDYADDAVDIATGLGEEVRVVGLSMGGVVAAWTGQFRDDVDVVVAVAPALGIPGVPNFLTTGFINLFDKLPNVSLPGRSELDHVYAGEATKGLVATFLMGRATDGSARSQGPAAGEVIVVVNPDDDEAPPGIVIPFAERWAEQDGRVTLVKLPAVGLPHDVIDPDQPGGDTELVYPIIHAALEGQTG